MSVLYSSAAGNLIYNGVVGTGLIDNDTLANATANQLGLVTVGVSIPLGFGILFGGEAILGVGTAGGVFAPVVDLLPGGGVAAVGPSMGEILLIPTGWGWVAAESGYTWFLGSGLYANLPIVAGAIVQFFDPCPEPSVSSFFGWLWNDLNS